MAKFLGSEILSISIFVDTDRMKNREFCIQIRELFSLGGLSGLGQTGTRHPDYLANRVAVDFQSSWTSLLRIQIHEIYEP